MPRAIRYGESPEYQAYQIRLTKEKEKWMQPTLLLTFVRRLEDDVCYMLPIDPKKNKVQELYENWEELQRVYDYNFPTKFETPIDASSQK